MDALRRHALYLGLAVAIEIAYKGMIVLVGSLWPAPPPPFYVTSCWLRLWRPTIRVLTGLMCLVNSWTEPGGRFEPLFMRRGSGYGCRTQLHPLIDKRGHLLDPGGRSACCIPTADATILCKQDFAFFLFLPFNQSPYHLCLKAIRS